MTLKVGAPVVLLKNLSKEFVNGSQGVVHEIGDKPVINFGGKLVTLERYKFVHESGSRNQYPVKLAFALTVHRAQGQTMKYVTVDCKDFFAPGQLGVAVGRATSFAGLQVLNYTSEIGRKSHSDVLTNFLKQNCYSDTDSIGSSRSSPAICCLKVVPEQQQLSEVQIQSTSEDTSSGASIDITTGAPVSMNIEYKEVLCECKLPGHTAQQVEINTVVDSLYFNGGINVFMNYVQSRISATIDDLEKASQKKSEGMKAQGSMEAISSFSKSLATEHFQTECDKLMGGNMSTVQRKVCTQIAVKYFNMCVQKRADVFNTVEGTAKPSQSEQLPDVLPDALRSKLRYIGGATMAKIKWRHNKLIKNNLAKIVDFTSPRLQQDLFDNLIAKEAVITENTADPASLMETSQRQNVTKSLTHVTDECFSFFVAMYRYTYELDHEKDIFLRQYSLQKVARLLFVDDHLLKTWCELFSHLPASCTEDEEVLLDSLVFQLYEEVCDYFIKVYHSDFVAITKSLLTEKKQSLRASLHSSKKRKVEAKSDKEKKQISKGTAKDCTTLEAYCGVCDLIIIDGVEDSIGCSSCDGWYHWHCVGVRPTDQCVKEDDYPWYCTGCTEKSTRKESERTTKGSKGKGKGRGKKTKK